MNLVTALENTLDNDQQIRSNAEIVISKFINENFFEYLKSLATLLSNESVSVSARQVASTLIKNPLIHIDLYQQKWKQFNNESRNIIKQLILSTLASEKPIIRKSVSSVIASLVRIEMPISQNWADLLPALCQDNFQNDQFRLAAIETLGYISEELFNTKVDGGTVDLILSALITNITKNLQNEEIVMMSLKAMIGTLRILEKEKFAIKQYSDIIMGSVFQAGDNHSDKDTILEIICRIFIEVSELFYDQVALYIEKISNFTFYAIEKKTDKLQIYGFEFWCRLGNEELNRTLKELNINNPNSLKSKRYFTLYFENLKRIIENFIHISSEEDLDEDWNVSKASSYLMYVLIQVVDFPLFERVVNFVEGQIFLFFR